MIGALQWVLRGQASMFCGVRTSAKRLRKIVTVTAAKRTKAAFFKNCCQMVAMDVVYAWKVSENREECFSHTQCCLN